MKDDLWDIVCGLGNEKVGRRCKHKESGPCDINIVNAESKPMYPVRIMYFCHYTMALLSI